MTSWHVMIKICSDFCPCSIPSDFWCPPKKQGHQTLCAFKVHHSILLKFEEWAQNYEFHLCAKFLLCVLHITWFYQNMLSLTERATTRNRTKNGTRVLVMMGWLIINIVSIVNIGNIGNTDNIGKEAAKWQTPAPPFGNFALFLPKYFGHFVWFKGVLGLCLIASWLYLIYVAAV